MRCTWAVSYGPLPSVSKGTLRRWALGICTAASPRVEKQKMFKPWGGKERSDEMAQQAKDTRASLMS